MGEENFVNDRDSESKDLSGGKKNMEKSAPAMNGVDTPVSRIRRSWPSLALPDTGRNVVMRLFQSPVQDKRKAPDSPGENEEGKVAKKLKGAHEGGENIAKALFQPTQKGTPTKRKAQDALDENLGTPVKKHKEENAGYDSGSEKENHASMRLPFSDGAALCNQKENVFSGGHSRPFCSLSSSPNAGPSVQPISEDQPMGMNNSGNTCYMASTLQVLLSSETFMSKLRAVGENESLMDKLPKDGVVATLLAVANRTEQGRNASIRQRAIDIKDVKDLVQRRFQSLRGHGQHDASEFFNYVMEGIMEEIVTAECAGYDGEKVPHSKTQCPGSRVFSLCLEKNSVGVGCSHKSKFLHTQWFLDFAVSEQRQDVARELYRLFNESDDETRACDECKNNHKCDLTQKLHRLPDVLVVHANRNQDTTKCQAQLKVPEVLVVDGGQISHQLVIQNASRNAQCSPAKPTSLETGKQVQGSWDLTSVTPLTCLEEEEQMKQALEASLREFEASQTGEVLDEDSELQMALQLSKEEYNQREAAGNSQSNSQSSSSSHSQSQSQDLQESTAAANEVKGESSQENREVPKFKPKGALFEDVEVLPAPVLGEYTLMGFVSHRGSSVQSGHYTAHVRGQKAGSWWLCNDDVVVDSTEREALSASASGSLFFYQKLES